MFVKGNLELIIFSFTSDQFYYEVLNLPILMKTSSEKSGSDNNVDVLFDAGPFLISGNLSLETYQGLTLTI